MRLYRDGTLSCTAGSVVLVGTGTEFLANVAIGDALLLSSGVCLEIVSVDDDTHLKVDLPASANASGLGYVALRFVTAAQYRDLSVKIEQFLTDRQTSLKEFTDWVNGTKTGGPNNDGRYPLTDRFGTTILCRCPALLDGVAESVLDELKILEDKVDLLLDNPSGYVLPKATTLKLGGVVVGTGLTVDVNGVLSVANGGAGGWASKREYTNASSSGTVAVESLQVTMNPAIDANNAVVMASKTEVVVNMQKNWISNGYPVTHEQVMSTMGPGKIGKLVTSMVQMNLTNSEVGAALGFEAVVGAIGSTTKVDALVGFMWPNARVVPNINNVRRVVAFLNQDTDAEVQSYGPFVNGDLVELAPPQHPGIVANRYYSAPYETLTSGALLPGKFYLVPVFVANRATVLRVGMNVVSGHGPSVKCRIGMYQTSKGQGATCKMQTLDIPLTSAGKVDYPVTQRLDPGTYFMAVEVNAEIVVTFSTGGTAHMAQQVGQSDPMAQGAALETNFFAESMAYGDMPAYIPAITYGVGPARPHLWYRT